MMGLKCKNGHPVPISFSAISSASSRVLSIQQSQLDSEKCPTCGEEVPIPFFQHTEHGFVFNPSLSDFEFGFVLSLHVDVF